MPESVREEVLWAAGFWEGEGSISLRSVTASQVHRWPLERLQRNFGGTIGVRHSKQVNKKDCWQWFACGEQARLFVALIYEHVSPRRQQQIDRVFITEEKRQRKRASVKLAAVEMSVLRDRDTLGRFGHAKIS